MEDCDLLRERAGRPPRILIVDDEATIRSLLTRILREGGYDVIAVTDGAAGLEAVRTATEPYDLVITNNCMPGMEGEDLIAKVRAASPGLPILHLDDRSSSPPTHAAARRAEPSQALQLGRAGGAGGADADATRLDTATALTGAEAAPSAA
jgi:CheY-like chemotaxis protein